jgi:hypothetical protein
MFRVCGPPGSAVPCCCDRDSATAFATSKKQILRLPGISSFGENWHLSEEQAAPRIRHPCRGGRKCKFTHNARYFAQGIVPHLHTEQPNSKQQRRGNAWYCLISNEQGGIRPPENKFNSAMVVGCRSHVAGSA